MPRRAPQPEHELNLAPIMNMVVILIPMLLLSVVFLQVGTINVTAPKLSPGLPSEDIDREPLNLTVSIREDGFHVSSASGAVPPLAGCPAQGATICLDSEDGAKLDTDSVERSIARYDWVKLYNTLAKIKAEHADETIVHITADANVPYALVVRLMDVARYRLEKESYASSTDLWAARHASVGTARQAMFPDPIIVP